MHRNINFSISGYSSRCSVYLIWTWEQTNYCCTLCVILPLSPTDGLLLCRSRWIFRLFIWAVFGFPVLVYLKTGIFIFITVYENEWEMDRWMDGSWLSLTAHTNFSKFWLEVSWDLKLSQWSQPGRLLCSCQLKQCVIKENSPDFWTTALHRRNCWLIEFWCVLQVYFFSKTACYKNV